MLNDITYERVLDETRAIIGDPDDAARQLTYIRETFGDVYPTFQINFGMMEKPKARRSMELFARHVIAALPLSHRHLRWRRGVPGIIGRTAAAGHRWTDAGRPAAPR